MKSQLACLWILGTTFTVFGDPQDPVKVFGKWKGEDKAAVNVLVGFDVEEKGFRVYKESVKVSVKPGRILEGSLPKGTLRMDPIQRKEKEIYTGKTSWPVRISKDAVGSSNLLFDVSITYRACNDVICHFPKTKHLNLSPKLPEVRADVLGSLVQFWDLLTSINAERAKELASQHIWLALLLCFFSGILTSLTPCVYPMIPITINIFGRISQQRGSQTPQRFDPQTFAVAAIYVAGMCATYSVMGLIAGLTGSLFGRILQSTLMLAFLTLLFFTLSLGQMGLFKMTLPSSWQTKLAGFGSSDNRFGIFVMGLISGLIVSPCVGPVIAGILAFVFEKSNPLLGLLYFLSFSVGLGVLFLLIGGFSGLISRLPRSGPWMVRINFFLSLLMLFASGYYGLLWMKQIGVIHKDSPAATQSLGGWFSSEDDALRLAQSKQLPVIIDFTAEWCEACHELEKVVFSDPKVREKLNDFVLLRIDVTAQTPENEAKLKKYGVFSLPAIVFLDRRGKIIERPRVHGFVPVADFLQTLEVVLRVDH